MSKEQKSSQPSDLTKGSKPKTSPELQESDLDKVTGGAALLLKLDGVKGESMDDKHKDEIQVGS
ncbi:MAG TPA: hypothetical protein VHA35_07625 [Dongiaceae bacterium]|jgi:hypothetical protein|nr:hypothetical protein [Dongiaceae bacterium]